jgi:hypothetical protein
MDHKVYRKIISAIKQGMLKEPFSNNDFRRNCPGLGDGTYKAFLYKHKKGNAGENSVLFEQVGTNLFKIIKPFKYGL